MTLKELQRKINAEKYDIKKAKVKVYLSSGEALDIVSVSLDKDSNEVVLKVSDDANIIEDPPISGPDFEGE